MMLRQLSLIASSLALFALGCSDAPARPARVGLYVMIRSPDSTVPEVAGRSCPASSGVEWDIGKSRRDANGNLIVDSPNSMNFGDTLEDGQGNARVTCTVRKSGAFISDIGGKDPQINEPNGKINFRLNGVAKENGTPATNTATASVYTPMTLDLATNPGFPGCIITTVHEQAPGALWADFSCPALTRSGDPAKACAANGTLVLEYCKTGEENE